MIRSQEKLHPQPSQAAQLHGRVPIFAVSGNLKRDEMQRYVADGFDGCMPKPVNVASLGIYLDGAMDESLKKNGKYNPAKFNLGGWF